MNRKISDQVADGRLAFDTIFGYIATCLVAFAFGGDTLAQVKRRSSLEIQAATIRALFLRELQTRFGSRDLRLGYLWVLLEPAFQVLVTLVIFSFILARHVPSMEYSVFLLTGILPWFMFSRAANRALSAVEGNQGLLNYRPVLPIDIAIARTALEFVIYFAVYVVLMLVVAWFGMLEGISNIPLLLFVWFSVAVFSLGFSLMMMVIGHFSGEIGKISSVILSILYFASGIIFPIQIIPEQYLRYLLWNPLIHAFETLRYAVSDHYPIYGIDIFYFLKSILVIMVVSLLLYKFRERRMMTT